MPPGDSISHSRLTVPAITGVNVAPLAGPVLLDWSLAAVMFVYWIELALTLIVLYHVLLCFAERTSNVAAKDGRMHGGPLPWPRGATSLQLCSRLPPMYARNLRFIPTNVVIVSVIWFLSAELFLVYTDPSLVLDPPPDVERFATAVSTAYSPGRLAVACCLFTIHAVAIGWEYFAGRQYERFSAAMLAEFPGRATTFWFVVLFVGAFATLIPRIEGLVQVTQVIAVTIAITSKQTADLMLVRVGRGKTSGWFTRWFVPYEPSPTSPTEDSAARSET